MTHLGHEVEDAAVVVMVPARNEAAMLPETLPGLLEQHHRATSVIVVDDGSEDDTAAVARRIATRLGAAQRLTVIRTAERPDGWVGKMWALESGWRHLVGDCRAEWLLLTDADIRHPPQSIHNLLAKAERGGYDMVSVMARLHTETFWERLVIPAFVFFFHLLYPFRLVSRRSSSVAAAAGGCVLVRCQALAAIGGFESIRDAVIDDVSLAVKLERAGYRLWLGLDAEITSVRPYEGLGDLSQMVARSAFVQLRFRYSLVALVVLGLGVFFAGPPLLAAAATAGLLLLDSPAAAAAAR